MQSATGQVHLFTPGWMFAVYLPSAATWTLNSSLTHIRVMFIFANVISPTLRPAFRLWALGCWNFCGNCRKLQRDDILYFLCSLQPGFIDTILYPAVVHCTVHQSCKKNSKSNWSNCDSWVVVAWQASISFMLSEKNLNCIKIITVSCAMGQMVWTRYPWWPLHDPDTLNTWFPNTECFKGPRILPSCWSRRLCQDPYAGVSTPSPSFCLPSTANSSNTVPRFPPQPPLSPLTHMCIVIRRGSGGGWGLGVGKEGGFNHLV